MREIKFNFYNTRTKQYTRWEESNAGMHMCSFYTHEHLRFLQFTGLKDKSGVEIYEDDVIGVELGNDYFYAIVKRGGWYWYSDMIFANDIIDFDDIGDENDMSADCDVLGNIYENPELLDAKE